jgi:hypothetical protein
LQLLSDKVLEGLARELGEGIVTAVVFRHSGWAAAPEAAAASAGAGTGGRRTLSPEEEAAVAGVAALAGDDDLGRRIAAAMRADLEGRPG